MPAKSYKPSRSELGRLMKAEDPTEAESAYWLAMDLMNQETDPRRREKLQSWIEGFRSMASIAKIKLE